MHTELPLKKGSTVKGKTFLSTGAKSLPLIDRWLGEAKV